MAGDRAEELVAVKREELDVGLRRHGRGPRHVAKERDLAEIVARAERADAFAVCSDLQLTGGDHVEAIAGLALADDLAARGRIHGCEARGEVVDRARREWFEDWNGAQQSELAGGHERLGVECADSAP